MKRRQYQSMVALFLFPATLLYLVFFIYPAIRAFYVSMFDWSGFTADMKFLGLGNFQELFRTPAFWEVSVKNTLLILLAGGLMIFVLAFVLSGVLTTKLKFRKTLRALLFFPSVLNPVAVAILWGFIYNNNWGLLNQILSWLGLGFLQRAWGAPETLFWAILAALVWMYTGFYCVMLVSALDQVPQSCLESADLDGAGEMRKFFSIKLPLIKDVLVTSIILWGITAVKEFALLFAWGGGIDIPPNGATSLAVKMYITAFGKRVSVFRMGYATAMGVVMFLLIAIFVGIVTFIRNRDKGTIEY